MNLDGLEQCLQEAAAASSVWAVIREAQVAQWLIVLEDESIVDVEFDEARQSLIFCAELGHVSDQVQRNGINDLVLRCAGVIPMPQLRLDNTNRYELHAQWVVDLQAPESLALALDELTAQVNLWRELINRPALNERPDAVHAPSVAFHQMA